MKIRIKTWILKIFNFLLPLSKDEVDFEALGVEQFAERVKPSPELTVKDAYAIYSYKDPLVKKAIWLLKYRGNEHALQILATLMAFRLQELLENLLLFENFEQPILVPVPMSAKRKKESNHTEKLCEQVLITLPAGMIEYRPQALSKIQETESQAKTKGRENRLNNLKGSITANSDTVTKRNIILIDDVITTGATIEECKRVLLKVGAKKVIALSLAH
jgi:competence protein ComFC